MIEINNIFGKAGSYNCHLNLFKNKIENGDKSNKQVLIAVFF